MFKWHLTPRLVVAVVLIQLITLGVLYWNETRGQAKSAASAQRTQLENQSRLLAAALAQPLAANDQAALLELLSLLGNTENLRYAGVYNRNEELVASVGEAASLQQAVSAAARYQTTLEANVLGAELPIQSNQGVIGMALLGYATNTGTSVPLMPLLRRGSIVLGGLVLTLIAIILLTRRLRGNIHTLENGLNSLRQGRWDEPVVASGALRSLAEDFNELAEQVQKNRSELRQRAEQHQQRYQHLADVLQGIHAVSWEMQLDNASFSQVSGAPAALLGYASEDWLAAGFLNAKLDPQDYVWLQEQLRHGAEPDQPIVMDVRARNSQDEWRWLRLSAIVEGQGRNASAAGLLLDVHDLKQQGVQANFLTDYDDLTQLVKRPLFKQQLDKHLQHEDPSNTALLVMDLDRFKSVNAAYGQEAGDAFLANFAAILRAAFGDNVMIGRLGGDEFGVILPNHDVSKASAQAETLLARLGHEIYKHEDQYVPISASIGIAACPEHAATAELMLTKATAAMYDAKQSGGACVQLPIEREVRRLNIADLPIWEKRLRHAAETKRFRIFMQPVVDIRSGTIRYYECLLRMLDETGREYGLNDFAAAAEHLGLLPSIERWSLTEALRSRGRYMMPGRSSFQLAINLSSRQINEPNLVETIAELAEEQRAEPESIIFEIPASVAAHNISRTRRVVGGLQKLGFKIAWDDFNFGTLSIQQLLDLPVDYLKIDGDSVTKILRSPPDQAAVRGVAELAAGLEIKVIAEAVESGHILTLLRGMKIDLGQGNFLAKPAPRFHEHDRVIVPEAVIQD